MRRQRQKGRSFINKSSFFITSLLIVAITYVSIFGLSIGEFSIPSADEMRFGIDIRGGVEATYFAKDFKGTPTAEQLNSAKSIIEERCDAQNILDREITVDEERGSILVRFPWKSDEKDFDPEKAIAELGETALLTFQDPDKNVLVEGKNVKQATAAYDQQSGMYVVQLEFDSEGAKAFETATGKLVGKQMSIYMDDILIQSPTVNEKISGGQAVITNIGDSDEAVALASKINSGSLPFALESKNYSAISPTLGTEALDVMVWAGIIAFIIICVFMVAYYRLPGFVAVFALMLQVAGQLLALSVPQFTLTLPGIAAVILSIGMGVDANIITAERIKEEVAEGKPVRAAIDAGYHKAFSSVFDGNITVIIVAIILMIFGSGTMLSFGYSLLTGVILNFICGVTASRLMTKSLAKFEFLRKPKLYGNGKKNEKVLPFNKNKVKFYIISGAITVIGIVCILINGIKLDIQFKGGAILNYTYNGDISLTEVDALVEKTLNRESDVQNKTAIGSDKTTMAISLAGKEGLASNDQKKLTEALQKKYPDNKVEISDVTVVQPFIGKDFAVDSIKAIVFSAILIILYVWFSFRKVSGLSAGVTGLIALFHDVVMVFLTFVIFGIPVNDSFIAAALTILGFSINDTIVIFDRIRENKRLYGAKLSTDELVDKSVTQSLTRSINTSLCTLIAIVVIYIFAAIRGLDSITSFALPMIFGIISGCYSSVCIAGPLWATWQKHKLNKANKK